jgi:hypothetical protein
MCLNPHKSYLLFEALIFETQIEINFIFYIFFGLEFGRSLKKVISFKLFCYFRIPYRHKKIQVHENQNILQFHCCATI